MGKMPDRITDQRSGFQNYWEPDPTPTDDELEDIGYWKRKGEMENDDSVHTTKKQKV